MILQALNAYYDRMSAQADDALAPPGFSYQPISFEVVLDNAGKIVAVNDCRTVDDKPNGKGKAKPRPSSMLVPQPPKRAGSAPAAAFLWDKTAFVFGMESADNDAVKAGAPPFTAETAYFERFKTAHSVLADSSDEGLLALHRFLQTWQPQDYAALQFAADMINTNVVFRLDFDDHHRHIHDRPAAKALWAAVRAQGSGAAATTGMCLVLGDQQPIARLHPAIKGVRGAQQAGGSIVSFNQDSFTSYGKEQGLNAPVSEQATFAYTTALNKLLLRGSGQSVQIGDATTVYWAEAADPVEARHAEAVGDALFAQRATAPDDDSADADAKELNTLRRKAMERIEKGLPLDAPDLKLREGTRFYILGLAPNQARLSIRFWEATTLGDLGRAFHQYWQDLEIADPPRRGPPPQIWQVVSCTSPSRRGADGKPKYSGDISPKLAGDFLRAILNPNRHYPATLLSTLVMRIRSDGHIDRRRVELLKACIVRRQRLNGKLPHEEYLMRTDPNDPDQARRLGRLFAVLERAQLCALGGEINSTIKDKFIGAAAATPAQVFVGLYKLSVHHTARLKKGHSDAKWINDANAARRTGYGLERDIGLLWKDFETSMPRQHTIDEQARFFVGYFQERYGGKPDPAVSDNPNLSPEAPALDTNDDSTETSE